MKITNKAPRHIKLQLRVLKCNQDTREQYQVAVSNRFKVLETTQDLEEKWENFKEAIIESVKETVPPIPRKTKKQWMTQEILELMDERRKEKNNKENYERLNKDIKEKCRTEKENWLERKCWDVERAHFLNPREMHRRINEITGKKTCTTSGCIKSKDGQIIVEKDKILNRWSEYIKELYDDDRPEEKMIYTNFEGPPIMEEEVRFAIKKMKAGKASGPDNITIEMIEPLEDLGVTVLTELLNDIYNTGHIPADLSKSIFIALPKKPAAIECELHRTISLMSHITKILLRIIMKRARNRIKPEIAEEQCGFVEGKGTANAIYILRNLMERSLEVKKDLYICFIDYTKAFDRVKHSEIIQILQNLDIDGKDLRMIRNIYWEQSAAVRIETQVSEFQPIKRGVRQGCVLSPDLFSLYSEQIMRQIKDMPGVKVNGHMINNIRYADDIALIAESENKLQKLMDKIVSESEKMGLSLNARKTETMVVSRKPTIPNCRIKVNNKELQQVHKFKYLGTWITSDGKSETEIKCIAQAKSAFQQMKNIFCNRNIAEELKMKLLQCYIEPVLLYACETWTMNQRMIDRIEAVEMWFLRRMLRISWTERKSNREVMEKANYKRGLLSKIRRRQAKFMGHIMRREGMENLVTTGKIDGKRAPGRQRTKMMDE